MKIIPEHNENIAKMSFATVYPLYIAKVERKGRTKAELLKVIEWLTGYDKKNCMNLLRCKQLLKHFSKRQH